MKYRLDPTSPQGISKDDDKIIPYFQDRVGKPSLIDSVNGKHGAVQIVGGTNVTVDNSGQAITISATGGGGGGSVDSVNGQTGVVVLDADDIDDTSTAHKFVTSTDLTTLTNTSGTNTGDQDLSGLVPNTRTVNGQALSSDVTIDADDVLPTQTGNNGKYLGTNGTTASWETLAGGGDMAAATYDPQNIADDAFDRANHTGQQAASTISDFDTEVSGNSDVSANTAARHSAVTVTDSTEIDFTLTGQDITASLKSGSVDESKLDTSVNASLDLADSSTQPGDDISDLNNDAGYTTNTGTVTSVGISGSDGIEIDSGSPVTTSGVIALGINAGSLRSHINVENGADVTDATNVAAAGAVMDTGNETIAGVKTFSSDPIVPDEAYDATAWNGSLEVPTKNAIRDKIETMGGGGDVVGPASSTDDAITRFSGTDGKTVQNSAITVSDPFEYAPETYKVTLGTPLSRLELSAGSITMEPIDGTTINSVLIKDGLVDGIDLGAVTATVTELNYTDGVTSNIQTQINTKVTGSASSTDNAIARFDLTTGKLLQDSSVTISDTGAIATTGNITANVAIVGGVTNDGDMFTDTIDEYTTGVGVTIDGVLLKDNAVVADTLEVTGGHGMEASGGNLNIYATAGDVVINENVQIDSLSLTADLSVANGGTGVSTLTSGNVLVGAGTSAVTTTKAAPTGDFVGTSDTQTLTNKTITQEAWIEVGSGGGAPAFQNSWVNFHIAYSSCAYMKDSFGFVHLKGMVKSGTSTATIFTLPAGYRPALISYYGITSNDSWAEIAVGSDGQVAKPVGGGNTFVSLDGITFRAA